MPWKALIITLMLTPALIGAEPAARTLDGKLVIPSQAHSKNSYFTGDFQLLTRDAQLILTPTQQVSEERLAAFEGRFVTVQAIYVPEQPANSMEQAPMELGPDGKRVLRPHPAHYRVIAVKAYPGKAFPVFKP